MMKSKTRTLPTHASRVGSSGMTKGGLTRTRNAEYVDVLGYLGNVAEKEGRKRDQA